MSITYRHIALTAAKSLAVPSVAKVANVPSGAITES